METAYFERFTIDMTLEDALSAPHPGPCDEDVKALLQQDYIKAQLDKISALKIRNELYDYGAWDAKELDDREANRARVIWIAAGNIREEGRS